MVVFRGHRGGSVAPATLAPPEASPRRVSGHRQAALEPSGGREKRPWGAALQALTLSSRGPCDAPGITADHAPGRKTRKAVRCVTLL